MNSISNFQSSVGELYETVFSFLIVCSIMLTKTDNNDLINLTVLLLILVLCSAVDASACQMGVSIVEFELDGFDRWNK